MNSKRATPWSVTLSALGLTYWLIAKRGVVVIHHELVKAATSNMLGLLDEYASKMAVGCAHQCNAH